MKPTLISKNRLKINISSDDLIRLNLSYDMLDYRDLRVRDVLNNIIDVASEQTGFNRLNEKILVETIPQSGGGCIICVTRLPGKKMQRRGKRQSSAEPYIFRFNSLSCLIFAGEILKKFSDIILGSLKVIFSKNSWYLSFAPVIAGLDSFRLDCLLGKLSEFGEETQGGKLFEAMLIEHGKLVAEEENAEKMFKLLA